MTTESPEVRAAAERVVQYARHKAGCKYRPDTPSTRAMSPKGVEFKPVPCSCGLSEAIAAWEAGK